MKVIYDCDNTMGLPERDVDDGLTLMYLLGSTKINLLGVTNSFGNCDINNVYRATKQLFKDLNLTNTPLMKGAVKNEDRKSEAAHFLVDVVNKYPNEVTLLATGSLTNLYGAYQIDPNFYKKVKEIVLMGGITEPLMINNQQLNELNFSVDNEAAHNVLHSSAKITVMTGHICLQAKFTSEQYDKLIKNKTIPSYNYIKRKSYAWFEYFKSRFAIHCFYNWDIVSGLYITNRELFDENLLPIISTVDDLKSGYLKVSSNNLHGTKINVPTTINDIKKFNEIIFAAWKNVAVK